MSFTNRIPVRFPDVDYARVLYFPRFFDYCHRSFEDFFASEGLSYSKLIQEQHVGFPTVHTEADFRSPLKFGDTARLELSILSLSEKSVSTRYQIFSDANVLCAEIKIISACIDMRQFRGTVIPENVKAFLGSHLATGIA